MVESIRINKYLRDKGFASRHEADRLIESGQVTVNGKKAEQGMQISENDIVSVKNTKKYEYLAYYKPRGLSTQDLGDSPSVINEWKRKGMFPIGRLDKASEGLMIITNDGRLTGNILGNKDEFSKEYVVTVKEALRKTIPAIFKKGMDTVEFGKLLPAEAKIVSDNVLLVTLREGKRHQIRIMLNSLNYTITKLKRVRIGNIHLGNMKPGQSRPLTAQEISIINKFDSGS